MITSKRRAPPEWEDVGPTAYAIQQMHSYISQKSLDSTEHVHQPLDILYLATIHTSSDSQGIPILLQQDTSNSTVSKSPPPWFPIQSGEQLCNLVGNWRILQRVGSHRWTTDDLVTAFMAQDEFKKIHLQKQNSNAQKNHHQPIHYLDLGCGNGSVLNMVLWSLLQSFDVMAFGIEARSEAVELARRSLSFNIGPPSVDEQGHLIMDPGHSCQATILHHDFRSLLHESSMVPDEQIKRVQNMKFHLITGTPPYFRVDFTSYRNPSSSSTSTETHSELPLPQAIINQGGMPTSIQSAPPRCDFRGGIEAYCEVASTLLSDDGIFVVCENWLNVDRVYSSASKMGLEIQSVLPVKGKEGRKENLFGVFVMCKVGLSLSNAGHPEVVKKELDPIIVRNKDGTWTKAYCKILKAMSIPPNTTSDKNE
jgi:tRNA1(Val) A37 N6-methylase TrmN6